MGMLRQLAVVVPRACLVLVQIELTEQLVPVVSQAWTRISSPRPVQEALQKPEMRSMGVSNRKYWSSPRLLQRR